MRRIIAISLALCVGFSDPALAQDTSVGPSVELLDYLRFRDAHPMSCLATYFPPFLIQNGMEMKSFVRSKVFKKIRRQLGDRSAVDAIYVRAMQLTNNNTAVALLLSTLASFDHQIVGLNVPVFELFFPLTNESEEEYHRRVRNLPGKLYPDSPDGHAGDRDKLQHFFGSAFLTVVFESDAAAERFGYFVETGEDAFIVDGVADARDQRSNRQGQQFGLALLKNNRRLPSEFLTYHVVGG